MCYSCTVVMDPSQNTSVLEALKCSTSTRPAIFAMSNPTKNAECTPEEAFSILGENIIFASGSPFKDVDLGNGHIGHCNQGNNMYLFPGIGLGTLLSGSRVISDGMLQAAAECGGGKSQISYFARIVDSNTSVSVYPQITTTVQMTSTNKITSQEPTRMNPMLRLPYLSLLGFWKGWRCLAAYMTEEEVLKGTIYPPISRMRDITKEVAAAVIKEAIEEDLAEGYRDMDPRELQKLNNEEIVAYVQNNMWSPEYPTLVYKNE
ncbi:hypothetical protein TEA_002378 [Camellia sinensis var. sinensis]|uniref:Malic enzyme NAD-binding domain-containing protein n=1 Tax=Camellia sinensis var. sinensis TaxID=542762 RepID=A0A4S4EUB0_CAMSN|nr:hypothetical protein TEA_002378 [Camellia sinensis var. sinensis]